MKKQNGITLIALVITIIVLLILAGVSINMVLGENGVLEKAQGAVEATRLATLKEEIEMWNADNEMSKYISGNTETLTEVLDRLVTAGTITETEKTTMLNSGDYDGVITIGGEDFSIKDHLASIGSEDAVLLSAGTEIEKLTNSSGTEIGSKISDGANGKIPVPTGFYYVGGTIGGGAVISDNASDKNKYAGSTNVGTDLVGNQFVFVPCTTTGESGKVAYAQDKQYNDGTTATKQYYYKDYTDWAETTTVSANQSSVTTYGGFYVGRYEAGIPSDADFYASAEGDTYYASTQKNVTTYTPVSKAKNPSWSYISQNNAETVSKAMYSSSATVTSNLIDSYAWDTISTWFGQAGKSIVDSSSYGNYYNSNFTVNDTLYAKHIQRITTSTGLHNTWFPGGKNEEYNFGSVTLGSANTTDTEVLPDGYDLSTYTYRIHKEIATGSTETTKVNNIYDMAGNMWEWTTEEGYHDAGSSATAFAVLRGGGFYHGGSGHPVVYRNGYGTASLTNFDVGFRVVLYIK